MDYRQALEFFRDRSDYDRGFISNPFAGDEAAALGLRRTRLLVDALGSPDRAYPIIHVAGTKGKGSTCAFIESVARRSGLTTGLFVTPHLHSVRERVQVNGQPVSEKQWSEATGVLAREIAWIESKTPEIGRITAFEFNTALALHLFGQQEVDIGIVEVGLGGRLDATNIVEPVVSVITPVSFDHEAILGETLAEIASEKGGIIKQGVPAVIASQGDEPLDVLKRIAHERQAPLQLADVDWQSEYRTGGATLSGPWGEFADVALGLKGKHQAQNAGVALMALWKWSPDLFQKEQAIVAGLRSVRWIGRFEQVASEPAIIVDGAHNGASMEVLVEALAEAFPGRKATVVFGSYRDKDLTAMLRALIPLSPRLIATRSKSPRAIDPAAIVEVASNLEITTTAKDSVAEAMQAARESTQPGDVIVACGSLSIVAESREYAGLAETPVLEREILNG